MENSNLLSNISNSKNDPNSKSHGKISQGVAGKLVNETAKFFGLRPVVYDTLRTAIELEENEAEREERKWRQRRFRHLYNQYDVRVDAVAAELQRSGGSDTLSDMDSESVDGETRRLTSGLESVLPAPFIAAIYPTFNTAFRPRSADSGEVRNRSCTPRPTFSTLPTVETRQSVAKMAFNTLGSILSGRAFKRSSQKRSSSITISMNNNTLSRRVMASLTGGCLPGNGGGCASLGAAKMRSPAGCCPPTWSHNAIGSSVTTDDLFFDVSPRPHLSESSSPITTTPVGAGRPQIIIEDPDEVSARDERRRKPNGISKRKPPVCSLPIYGAIDPAIACQLRDESFDYRPFFTFWITTVQVVVMLVMLIRYGVGTYFSPANYFGVIERSGDVTSTFLSMSHIVVWEQNNVWIGPRFADLVHAGAKYTPCMRQDVSIHAQILAERREESLNTGCCIGAEGGCFQSSECPKQFARLVKWSNMSSFDPVDTDHGTILSSMPYYLLRVVCGQDPRYCLRPKSVAPFDWNRSDISTWPFCEESRSSKLIPRHAEHMHCTITGRPCCIQMHGQCRITTPEYCAFVRGHYHANATLCSQVSCLNSVCGMTPFLSIDRPDQIYRLITPLFMHAGVIRCAISVFLQMGIMRNFEIMIGWLRLSMIYFVSGVGGYLASAVFVPYMPEVGPAGSQGGVLGALIVNVIYNWNFLRHPARTLAYHLAMAAALFVTGLLPFVDNWAQLFGFVFGCLLAAALIPYIVFGKKNAAALRRRRLAVVIGSLAATALLFVVLLVMFYTVPVTSFAAYGVLRLLNCPFAGKVCEQQGLFLRSWLPI